jgi:hypothetical protein
MRRNTLTCESQQETRSTAGFLREFEAYLSLDMIQDEQEGLTKGDRKRQYGSTVPYYAFSFARIKGSLRGGKSPPFTSQIDAAGNERT